MADASNPTLVLPVLAIWSRYDDAFAWAADRARSSWGSLLAASPRFRFDATDYYESAMGRDLDKQFLVFARPADPAALADWKLATNAWERDYAAAAARPEPRPINLDPGYLTPGKLVQASCKDFAHRVYLRHGVYAEVTLTFRAGRWEPHRWTFPDFRRDDYQTFFSTVRGHAPRPSRDQERSA